VSMPTANPTAGAEVPRLRRVLTLWDLIFYAIVAVTPSAPATVYGLAEVKSGGYVVVTILAAMVAMVLTAISYGRMAALYPSAGSAYAYVSRGIHPYLGFVAGWAMLFQHFQSNPPPAAGYEFARLHIWSDHQLELTDQ
jgi:putrescine importer